MNATSLKLVLIVTICCAALTITAKPITLSRIQGEVSSSIVEAKFDPFGGYAVLGKVPPELNEFDSFQLDLTDKQKREGKLKIAGYLSAQKGQLNFHFKVIGLTLETLTFTTEMENGISFRFEGRFLKKGAFSRFSTRVPVLEGMLVKLNQGNKVAESKLRFFYFVPY